MKHKLEILRYCREVRRMLPCRGEQRRRIMEKIRAMVDHYAEENARVGYEDLVSRFGTPEQIASACLNEQDERIIIQDMRFGKRVTAIVLSTVVVFLLMWAGAIGIALEENRDAMNGYGIEYIPGATGETIAEGVME